MDLYTSLTPLKNGGELPPMTPLTEEAKKYIDPAFTIGMGALFEDSTKGLRCPLRGCGVFRHALGVHLGWCHGLGARHLVIAALDLPFSVSFDSAALKAKRSATMKASVAFQAHLTKIRRARTPLKVGGAVNRGAASHATAGARNLRGQGDAQLGAKIMTLQRELGHPPTRVQAAAKYGVKFTKACSRAFGSWTAALASVGLRSMNHASGGKVVAK